MLWGLFVTFFKIGLVSFGGGYAMIPLIEKEAIDHHWMGTELLTTAIGLAGMSPGPIATNLSIFIGYQTAGLPGALISTFAVILPSMLIVVTIAAFFFKVYQHKWVKSAFYGLRPIVTGLILYAAIHFGIANGLTLTYNWHTLSLLLIFIASLIALMKYKMHPLFVIVLSGLVGTALY